MADFKISGFTPGARYYYASAGNIVKLTQLNSGTEIKLKSVFVAEAAQMKATGTAAAGYGPLTGEIYGFTADYRPCGYQRFNDPQGFDCQVLLVDDWRNLAGEDGGRGRAYRIQSGNEPIEVPLNGHDIWDEARIVPCYNGLVLLRTGNERHYFTGQLTSAITGSDAALDTLILADTSFLITGRPVTVTGITGASGTYYVRVDSSTAIGLYDTRAHALAGGATGRFDVTVNAQTGTIIRHAVDPVSHRIWLNAAPAWNDTDKVKIVFFENAIFSGNTVPNADSGYYVKTYDQQSVELYTDQACTTLLTITDASGSFYLERQANNAGFYGNGAPALLAQPNALGNTLWDGGFDQPEATPAITGTSASTDLITCPNHRLLPGDHVETSGITLTGASVANTGYARIISDNAIQLYDTQLAALAGDAAKLLTLTDGQTGTLKRVGASGLPLPPGREGCYFQNQLIIVNGQCTLAVSDPLDPLHFTPFNAAITANLGEADAITAVVPFGTDSLVVLKENTVEVLTNFSGGSANWSLTALTREYGCIAPRSVAQTGNDVWFLSRKGVASITQTANGVLQGVAEPVSRPVQKYIDLIDWNYAGQASAAYWANRYFLAVPLKGQTGTVKNNCLLVYNFLNQGWEGIWTGTNLLPFGLARHLVNGEERLCFCDYTATVRLFTDGFTDDGAAIADSLTTRRFTGGNNGRKLWLSGELIWDTHQPNLTVTAVAPGYNEELQLSQAAYAATQYLVNGLADYDPATSTEATFDAPLRGDYSLTPAELLVGKLNVHQNIAESVRMRVDEWGLQLRIENVSGSARLQSVRLAGVQRDMLGVRKV